MNVNVKITALAKLIIRIALCAILIENSGPICAGDTVTHIPNPDLSIQPLSRDSDQYPYVSIISLIANPQLYKNTIIQVCGYVSITHENYALYLHEDDFKYINTKNAIWLNISIEQQMNDAQYHKTHVCLIGVFKGKPAKGNRYSGAINVIGIEKAIDRTELDAARRTGGG